MPKKSKKHNKSTGRDYKKEYARYQGKPSQIKRRSMRNKARRKMAKAVGKAKIKGKDVHHVRGVGRGNNRKNLRVTSKRKNRSFKRDRNSKRIG